MQQESGQRLESGVARQLDAVIGCQVANIGAAIELDQRGVGLRERPPHVVFIRDFAEHLLEHIFERNQSGDGAELVHHHCKMRVFLAEFIHQLMERLGLRHH
jgi:hypothetical protein